MQINSGFSTQTTNMLNQHKTNTDAILSKIGATRELSGKDTANLVISDALASQISTLGQSIQNSNETVGMYQIADASLQVIQAGSEKLNELSVRYNSASLNSDQRAGLAGEFADITKAMQQMAQSSSYNGQSLLSQTFGLDVSGMSELSITDQEGIQAFSQNVSTLSSTVGSRINAEQVSLTNSLSAMSALSSANAQISEQPLDQKISNLTNEELKLNSALLAQTHQTTLMQQRISALLS